jgi:hypothetical protein
VNLSPNGSAKRFMYHSIWNICPRLIVIDNVLTYKLYVFF